MNPKIRETASGGGAVTTHLKSELHCDESEALGKEVIVMQLSDGLSTDEDRWMIKMEMEMMEETMMGRGGVGRGGCGERRKKRSSCWPLW